MNLEEMKQLSPNRQKELFKNLNMIRAKGKTANYSCLPLDTEVLTDSGWKYYHEMTTQDEVMCYNHDLCMMEYTPILACIAESGKKLYEINLKDGGSIVSTANHRWINEDFTYTTTEEVGGCQKLFTLAPDIEELELSSSHQFREVHSIVKLGGKYSVFCLNTLHSNFLVRQGETVTLTGNCVYGAGAATIAQSADIPLKEAEALHKAYWKIHAYVKDIADDQCIIRCKRGHNWIINPINGFCYSVRTEKDIFSTLIQGSGAFMFDMWVDNILTEMYDRWGVRTLTGQFHDEFIISIKDDEEVKKLFDTITQDAIMKVNRDYKLRFELGCDVSFGYKYSEIH